MFRTRQPMPVGLGAVAIVAGLLGTVPDVSANGGQVILKTDNTADGFYYGLSGNGSDVFITEYRASELSPGATICGVRLRALNQGNTIAQPMIPQLRREDPGNPGYPDFTPGGLIATADPGGIVPCSTTGEPQRYTFGSGAGLPAPAVNVYIVTPEPLHGPNADDFCGLLQDTSSLPNGFSKIRFGGQLMAVPWNHFQELDALQGSPVLLTARSHGASRFGGDPGIKAMYARRANAGQLLMLVETDDKISHTIVIDNSTGPIVEIIANLKIEADLSVFDPMKMFKDFRPAFQYTGTGQPVQNPIRLPEGRTILRVDINRDIKTSLLPRLPVNLPWRISIEDPGNGNLISQSEDVLGIRRTAGKHDDGRVDAFFSVQSPTLPGDALNVLSPSLDLPRSANYSITGIELVGGEFEAMGLPGFEAVEVRFEDPVMLGSPDLTMDGLVVGVGPVPTGVPPTVVTIDTPDVAVNVVGGGSFAPSFFVRAVFFPGETSVGTRLGADQSFGTLLGNSSVTVSGQNPVVPDPTSNYMLRLCLDGANGTLTGPGGMSARHAPDMWNSRQEPYARVVGRYVAVDVRDFIDR